MMYFKFLKSLMLHKWYVFLAGLKTGAPIWRLIVHDWQKFSKWEFAKYARNFFGERTEKTQLDFAYAWLHHENTAPHHWGYWICRSGKYTGKPLEMPEVYVREMIADWMGASRAYTNSWDMTEWLQKNLDGFLIHEETINYIHIVLSEIGYDEKLVWQYR